MYMTFTRNVNMIFQWASITDNNSFSLRRETLLACWAPSIPQESALKWSLDWLWEISKSQGSMAVGIKKGREFGMDMCTWLYLKWMTNCGGPTVDSTSSTLLNVMWPPGWEGRIWGRMETCPYVAESLLSSPETTTTLFVNWLYPNTK